MKDDNLDDTGIRKVKILYGGKPIAQAIADGDTKMDRECKPDAIKALAESVDRKEAIVGKEVSVYHKEIWNAAIEAAAIKLEHHQAFQFNLGNLHYQIAEEIRKLKK